MDRISAVAQPHIAELVRAGKLVPIDVAVSEQLARFIEQGGYPFVSTGYHLDWDKMPGTARLRWDEATDLEAADFLCRTTLSTHLKAAVWFGRGEPCVVGRYTFVAYNLSEVLRTGWGARYLFGVDGADPSNFRYAFEDFVEVDRIQWLSGRLRTDPGPWHRKVPDT